MEIYNQEKTKILENPDLTLGKLVEDKIIRTEPEILACEEQGHYKIVQEYPNGGKDVEWIVDREKREYVPEKTIEEKILIYVPFTAEEMNLQKKQLLRQRRVILLEAFDKWEKAVMRSRELDDSSIMEWYYKLLDLDEYSIENIPTRIQYYL